MIQEDAVRIDVSSSFRESDPEGHWCHRNTDFCFWLQILEWQNRMVKELKYVRIIVIV